MSSDRQQPDGGGHKDPRREPSRMGGMLMVVLVVTMVFLILKAFNQRPPGSDDRTFAALQLMAYQGRVKSVRFIGDMRVDADVSIPTLEGSRTETWDAVPVPEFATDSLAELERIVARRLETDVGLDDLRRAVASGQWTVVEGYTLNDDDETGLYVHYMRGSESKWAAIQRDTGTSDADVAQVIAELTAAGADIDPAPVHSNNNVTYEPSTDLWSGLLITMIPWLLIMGFFLFIFTRQMRASGGGGGIMSFGRSRVKMVTPDQAKVTFDQVAGVEEAKEEVQEIIQFLKDPKRFSRLGGRVPRGVLLVGPPGTGKTLLAKAIAGEASVPFFPISGSDFVEMFVGVGASRVRDLFKQARESAPCVIFLDEIDAVGRKRGAGLGGGHDEREQTLNAILVEMDGFDTDAGVIMIAATNRPDVLDPALLRPGRFDRQIVLDLPDVRGREAILVVHAQRVAMSPKVDLTLVARSTPMFSGAELEALINEAALIATLKNKEHVENDDLEEARDKVRFGRQKKSRVMEEEDRRVTAYHEAGHALVASQLEENVERVHKVTIIPRGMALGSTMQLPEKDKYHHRKKELLAMLAVLFGGRVAEQLFCDDISGGASNDIERATDLARHMVCALGMSDALGPVALGDSRGEVFLGDELMRSKNYSEATSEAIDREVRRILDEAYAQAVELLEAHRAETDRVAQALLKYETINGDEVRALIAGAEVADLRPELPERPVAAAAQDHDGTAKPIVRERDEPEPGYGGLPAPEPA